VQVDAFTVGTAAFTGNPAVVFLLPLPVAAKPAGASDSSTSSSSSAVPLAATSPVKRDMSVGFPPEQWMAATAAEFNISVTAFVVPYTDGSYGVG
jgi:predicted PhzF superfamily epimerase YddE/YHI9